MLRGPFGREEGGQLLFHISYDRADPRGGYFVAWAKYNSAAGFLREERFQTRGLAQERVLEWMKEFPGGAFFGEW